MRRSPRWAGNLLLETEGGGLLSRRRWVLRGLHRVGEGAYGEWARGTMFSSQGQKL